METIKKISVATLFAVFAVCFVALLGIGGIYGEMIAFAPLFVKWLVVALASVMFGCSILLGIHD